MNIYVSAVTNSAYDYARQNHLGCEIMTYSSAKELDSFDIVHARVTESARGIGELSMHGVFDGVTYATNDALIVEVTKKRFLQNIRAASFHGVQKLIFHSAYRTFFGINSRLADYFVNTSISFWQKIATQIPDGMTVFIENVEDEDPSVFARILDGISSPKIGCCLDVGHAHAYSSVPVDTWIKVLGSRIGHVHINDNDGKSDLHLPLGKGSLPLAKAIHGIEEYAGEDIPFVLECDAAQSITWLAQNNLL